MAIEIVGSHLKAQAGYGETSDATPSSIRKGDPAIKRSAFAKSVIAADGAIDPTGKGDFQTRPISSAAAVPVHPGSRNRSHEGGTVPAQTARKDKAGVTRPTR